MLGLKGRQDGFRLLLPREFFHDAIIEKYTQILTKKHSFIMDPVEYVNQTIQKVDVLGFTNATVQQNQTATGEPWIDLSRVKENNFLHTMSEYTYRSEVSPLQLIDKTLNIEFRHELGYLNYFILFENFWYTYARDTKYQDMVHQFNIDILNEKGVIYSRIVLYAPIVNGMDMLSFDYTQPIAQSGTFKIEFKYSNLDFEFLEI